MKFLTYTIFLFILFFNARGQNHVPNGDFEQYVTCGAQGPISRCTGWYSFNGASPDYFSGCLNTGTGVPNNSYGSEPAASGIGYIGLIDWHTLDFKEYAARPITPLQVGNFYEVSLSISMSDNALTASDGLGAFFWVNGPTSYPGANRVNVTPQVSFSSQGPFTNKNGWVRVSGTFFADSAYNNIAIGGFVDNASLNTAQVPPGTQMGYTLYYVDSVVVKLATKITINFNATLLCAGATINVPYTVQNITFAPGNIFTLQLSDASGNFTSPVNIGTTAATTSGNVQGVIPPGTPQGTGYKLRLISSNPVEISNTTGNININAVPAGLTKGSNSPVCAGSNINLAASSTTPGVTYNWTGPLSYTAATQNPTRTGVTVPMSGYYVVTANNNGCISKDSTLVTVNPALNVNASSNAPICTGGTLVLNSTGGGTTTNYNWYGPNSFTSTQQNPTIPNVTPAAAGAYMLAASQGPCTDTAYTTVSLGTPPTTPTVGSNSPVCSGNSINLTASSSSPGVTYSWTGPSSYTSTLQNPTRVNATTAMSGTYTVIASIGACPAQAVSTNVVVNQTPAAPTATNNGPLCAGVALDLFATGQTGATYQWNGPTGYNNGAQNPTILGTSTANAGTYTVTQTVNGCTSAGGTTNVVINNSVSPAVAVFPSPNDTICPGQTVVFVSSPNNGGTAPQYQWKRNGNNIAGATNPNYTTAAINSGDFFSCELTSNAACAVPQTVLSNNILMTVEPPKPCEVTITANPGLVLSPWELVTFTATPVRGGLLPSYQWLRNGQAVIGAVSETWGANNLNSNDTISVVLFSTDPCAVPNTDTSNYLVVNVKTGIGNIHGEDGITIYPNPNNGNFIVKGYSSSKDVAIRIFNTIGQRIYDWQSDMTNIPWEHRIQLNVAAGVYMIQVTTDKGTETQRLEIKD